MLRSVEGAEDDIGNARRLVGHHGIGADDVLVAVAASGTTPFTLACLRASRTRGALTVGIANNQGTPILEESHHPIFLDTGPEPIAGSTRLKAGTAQKITLNGLSTLLMILLGRVYRSLMVDVRASNEKLVRRSERSTPAVFGFAACALVDDSRIGARNRPSCPTRSQRDEQRVSREIAMRFPDALSKRRRNLSSAKSRSRRKSNSN